MKITTQYVTNNSGTGQIKAKGMGRQATVTYNQSKSKDWNHGTAAGALILVVQRKNPELQYGDRIDLNAVRSIDAGYSTHTLNDNQTHTFEV